VISVMLPLPPSANHAFRNVAGRGRVTSPDYKAWKMHAGLLLKVRAAGQSVEASKYEVEIIVPAKMRGDIDNRIKPIVDLLVASGRVCDDRHMQSVMISRSAHVEDGQCKVMARAADNEASAIAGRGPKPLPALPRLAGAEAA
jgi:Holliday junction resolvase RusA-like endonuclease